MKKQHLYSIFFVMTFAFSSHAQTALGKWKTIDDETGKAKSVVEIYENNGKIYGKIVEIFDKTKEGKLCSECEGAKKNKPILGMVILEGLSKKGKNWEGGTILDPNSGKVYKCTISLENKDKLKLRGYIGISLIGRTQYWERIK